MAKRNIEVPAILDAAIDHFTNMETQSIEVDEWINPETNEPFKIYWEPLNLKQRAIIYKRAKNDDYTSMVFALIYGAKDADGNKLFTIEHKQMLMTQVDPTIVSTIAKKILGIEEDEDDLEKK